MKKINKQLGSAHIIIIVLLVVALSAALGVVFYQNFIAKQPVSDQPKQVVIETPTNFIARVAFNSTIYDFDYPKEWKMTSKQAGSTQVNGSTTYIQNTAGTIRTEFTISDESVADACDQTSTLKISSYTITNAVNTKLTGQSLSLVEALFDHTSGGYDYSIGLTQDGGATHAAVGDAFCNVADVGTASSVRYAANGTILMQPFIIAKIEFPKLPGSAKTPASTDMQTIKSLMNTSDYRSAVAILESARKE